MMIPTTIAMLVSLALLNVILSSTTGVTRGLKDVWHGHEDNARILTLMRAQGNLIEYAPLAILLVLALELQARAPAGWIAIAAAAFLLARIVHSVGYIGAGGGKSWLRFAGAGLTTLSTLAMIALLGYHSWWG